VHRCGRTGCKADRIKILVATSVAARGLDVKEQVLVVNYDCPNHNEDYSCTGRTGNKGHAYTPPPHVGSSPRSLSTTT